MSLVPESDTGIWLNTPVRFFVVRSNHELHQAKNDCVWGSSGESELHVGSPARTLPSALRQRIDPQLQHQARCLPHLHLQRYRSPYTHVKYVITTETLSNFNFIQQLVQPSFKLNVLDIGCSFQMLRNHLRNSIQQIEYTGADSSPDNYPDILCDLASRDTDYAFRQAKANAVVALDVLPELHDTQTELLETLKRWLEAINEPNALYVFSIPECYTSDEYLLELSSQEWLELLGELFIIEDVQAVGFISALPYWLRSRLANEQKNWLKRTMNILKEPWYDSHVLKTTELWLTRMFRRAHGMRKYSHSLIVSARPIPK